MAQELTIQSAGVSVTEIDLSGPRTVVPVGIPAGIIATATRGPAFVPVTLATVADFFAKFGNLDGEHVGPYTVAEWLRNAQSVTYLRVLGIGDGRERTVSGNNLGKVTNAGWVTGQELPQGSGNFNNNLNANNGGPLGRTYFLGCYMSESAGSTVFSSANRQLTAAAVPIIRGVIMAPSGVLLRLSSSIAGATTSAAPASTYVAVESTATGKMTGAINLLDGTIAKQEFTILLNGHKGTLSNPTVITASFDVTAQNYITNTLNTNPLKIEEAGHYLYTSYDISSALALCTGSNLLLGTTPNTNIQESAFLVTGSSATRNSGSVTVPNYENFEDRYRIAKTPYFISQNYGGSKYNLFRLHSYSDGADPNAETKVSIENLTPSTDLLNKFCSFDVVLRAFGDLDTNLNVLESYLGVTLDPSSNNYILKRIGDARVFFDLDKKVQSQRLVVDGSYPNKSNRIRVELSTDVLKDQVPHDAIPVGFRGPSHLVTSGSAPINAITDTTALVTAFSTNLLNNVAELPIPFRPSISVGTGLGLKSNADFYWGVHFELGEILGQENVAIKPNGTVAAATTYFPDFHKDWINVSTGSNPGAATTAANGIIDSDKFNNNLFTLENVQVVTSSGDAADPTQAKNWSYIRQGNVAADAAAKTRAFDVAKDLSTPDVRALFKYTTIMQGGFDGLNIFNNETATMSNVAVQEEMTFTARGLKDGPTVSAYNKALEIIKQPTNADIKLLAIPGIRHASVTDNAIESIKERFDALYVMDIEGRDNLDTVITSSAQIASVKNTVKAFQNRSLDSSFAAAYYPDAVITDAKNGNVEVPASTVVLGAYALNDRIGQPWLAPAGNTRGALPTTLDTTVKLSQANLDSLYTSDINPLLSRPDNGGVVVWGQKTLQVAQSALDRVNVRRLLINIRRQVRGIANLLLFEPNRASTLQKFSSAVEPRLALIQQQQGLENFKVVIDASTTTQADVENNTIRGKIFLQPTHTAEFISLDFVVTNAGQTI